MTLNYVALTITVQDAGQDAGSGGVLVAPTSAVTAAGATVVSNAPVSRQLSGGAVTVSLVATDNSGTTPAAGFWAYQVTLPGGQPQAYLVDYANGASQRLDNLTPVVALTTYGPAAGASGFSNPMTTLGDTLYEDGTPAAARLAGNTTSTRKFFRQAGDGSVSAAPAWDTLQAGDIPDLSAGYVAVADAGAASGVATLDAAALLPVAQLPNVLRSDYKFSPESYGGKSDLLLASDAAMTASSAAVTCATSAPFGVHGAGSVVYVPGAGAGGGPLYATVASVSDSSHATLSVAASTTVTAAGIAIGTDNTAAMRAARTDALAFVAASVREACIPLLGGAYGAAGAPVAGGSTLGNAWFALPVVPATARKARLRFAGDADVTGLLHWQQTVPQLNGPVIVMLSDAGAVDSTYGPPSVFGGPFDGYGAASSLFTNLQVTVDGVGIAAPWDSGWTGWDFLGVAEHAATNWSMLALATVASSGWPDITSGSFTKTATAMRAADVNNNDLSDMGRWSVEGVTYGIMPSDHATWEAGHVIYCYRGVRAYAGSAAAHAVFGGPLSAENCDAAVGVMPSGVSGFPGGNSVKLDLAAVDIESCRLGLDDPGDLAAGRIAFTGNYPNGSGSSDVGINGGTGVTVTYIT